MVKFKLILAKYCRLAQLISIPCEIDPASDLAWCLDGARNLIAGRDDIALDGPRPFVIRAAKVLSLGETPAEMTGGEIPWAAKGFIIYMPAHNEVAKYFRSNNGIADYERLISSVLLHELVHFRQYSHPDNAYDTAPAKPTDTHPETLLASYYSDPREIEAHAAQIAFLIGPVTDDEQDIAAAVFECNLVGRRICSRLNVLRGGPMSTNYDGFRSSLIDEVKKWRNRLYPVVNDANHSDEVQVR